MKGEFLIVFVRPFWVQNNTLARYNLTLRNTTDFCHDKLHMDLSAMYMRVKEQNMISQGLYFNPIVPIYLFPAGDDIRKYMPYEQYDPERNFKVQYWPFGNQGLSMMNPYWEINRDNVINHKDRFILSGGLTWDIADGIRLSGRAKIDKTSGLYEKKYHASTDPLFAGEYGAYFRTDDDTRQLYGDAILNIDKYIGDFSLTANLGTSIVPQGSWQLQRGGQRAREVLCPAPLLVYQCLTVYHLLLSQHQSEARAHQGMGTGSAG